MTTTGLIIDIAASIIFLGLVGAFLWWIYYLAQGGKPDWMQG